VWDYCFPGMSRFIRMKSGAKNLKTRLHRKELEAASEVAEMKSIVSQPQMDFTGLEANDLIQLLTKECSARIRLTDEVDSLRERFEAQTEAIRDLENEQVSQNIVKEQFATELEKLKKNETATIAELNECRKEKQKFEALWSVLQSDNVKRSAEVESLKKEKVEVLTKNESLSLEIKVIKSNYQKLEEMLSDEGRLEKVQYENVKKIEDELTKCRQELAEVRQEKESSDMLRLQYEHQLEQLEAQLVDAKVNFDAIVSSTQKEISDAKTREEKLDELLKASRAELEEKQTSIDTLSKALLEARENIEGCQKTTELQHEENIKRLEKGFSIILKTRDEEVEKLQIISNKYRKKNESLRKDIRNLLKKLETCQRNGTPSVGSRGSTPGNESDLPTPQKTLSPSQSNRSADWESESIASLPISFSRTNSKVRFKNKLERAKVWSKQHNLRKVMEKLPRRSEPQIIRRCTATDNLSKTQLIAKCNTLKLLAGELTLQVDTYNEQVRNLKFASTYLGKRVLALESTLELMPGEEIPTNIGSRIADLRAAIESEKQENIRVNLSVVEESRTVENLKDKKFINQVPDGHYYECKVGAD